MKTLFNYFRVLVVLLAVGLVSSCDDDAPEAENDVEAITTVVLSFTPQNGGNPFVVTARDADGPGAGSIVIGDITLEANTTYVVGTSLLNELETPTESISEEVLEEAEEHQLFYAVAPTSLLTVTINDQDAGGLPLGLATTWATSGAGTGTVTVTLKHQPDGIKTATSTVNDGETDVAVTFPVTIQ